MWREWIEILVTNGIRKTEQMSPSVWREWIEMFLATALGVVARVSLRVEGVD